MSLRKVMLSDGASHKRTDTGVSSRVSCGERERQRGRERERNRERKLPKSSHKYKDKSTHHKTLMKHLEKAKKILNRRK